jgi:hypothetical protein
MRGGLPFLASHAWLEIIFRFRVSFTTSILSVVLIPLVATTVEVERTFSQGRLVLPHIRNRLSSQSTRALMCVGNWSRLGLVKGNDILPVLGNELIGEEDELPAGWDDIRL